MRVNKENCFVLRTTPFSESSLIVDAFSRSFGRINLLAKGARRAKSRLRGKLRPFSPLLLSWSGKGNLPTLIGLIPQQSYTEFKGDIHYSSCYLNELVVSLLQPQDPHPALFDEYSHALSQLRQQADIFHTLRVFEKNLLKEIGYALVLETESDHKTPIRSDRQYYYDFVSGPTSEKPSGGGHIVSGQVLLAIASEQYASARIRRDVRVFLDRALQFFLEGKNIHSRAVFRQTREQLTIRKN